MLLGINIALFLLAFGLQILTGEFERFDSNFLSLTGVFSSYLIETKLQLWLFITSEFVHFNPIHFAFNMYALYSLGNLVSYYYSQQKLLITYVLGAIGASLATYMWAVLSDDFINTLGASGAIFALLGLLISGTQDKRFGASLPIDLKAFYPTLIMAVVISAIPGVNWAAHLGGFVIGFILGIILKPEIGYVMNTQEQRNVDILEKISKLLLFLTAIAFVINFINILLFVEL